MQIDATAAVCGICYIGRISYSMNKKFKFPVDRKIFLFNYEKISLYFFVYFVLPYSVPLHFRCYIEF